MILTTGGLRAASVLRLEVIMFRKEEILKEFRKSTRKICAGNGGYVTQSMCEERETPIKPLKHGFRIHNKSRVLKLIKKQGGVV